MSVPFNGHESETEVMNHLSISLWGSGALPLRRLSAALALLTALSASAVINVIQTVSPASAQQGTNGVLVKFTLNSAPPQPPPTNVAIRSVTLGSIAGTVVGPRTNQYLVYASFAIPGGEAVGVKAATILYSGAAVTSYLASAFTVTAAPLSAQFSASPTA